VRKKTGRFERCPAADDVRVILAACFAEVKACGLHLDYPDGHRMFSLAHRLCSQKRPSMQRMFSALGTMVNWLESGWSPRGERSVACRVGRELLDASREWPRWTDLREREAGRVPLGRDWASLRAAKAREFGR
jgi:hypothetical protein